MRPLSIPAEEPPGPEEEPRDLAVRVLVPAAVAVVFIGVLIGERGKPRWDLQVVAPLEARSGASIGIRGRLLDLKDVTADVPEVPVSLRLLDGARSVVDAEAGIDGRGDFEAELVLPEDAEGALILEARAALDEDDYAIVTRQIRVGGEARPSPTRGRLQQATQQYELRRLQGDDRFELAARIEGGACQPEHPCTALVWMGARASLALVEAEGIAPLGDAQCGRADESWREAPFALTAPVIDAPGGADPDETSSPEAERDPDLRAPSDPAPSDPAPSDPANTDPSADMDSPDSQDVLPATAVSAGVLRCTFRLRGNEGRATLLAHDGGRLLARRRMQIPVALGAPAVDAPSLVPPGAAPTLTVHQTAPGPFVVDVFQDDHWRHALSSDGPGTDAPSRDGRSSDARRSGDRRGDDRRGEATGGATDAVLPTLDSPGIWRVQVRRNPSSEAAGARLVLVTATGDLEAIVQHPAQERWGDPLAVRVASQRCDDRGCDAASRAAFLLAAGELELALHARWSSGATQELAGLHDRRGSRRLLAAALVVLGGIFVAIVVVRRGRRATRQAERVMQAAGLEDATSEARRRKSAAGVYGSALFVVAVFVTVAAMILARGC